METYKKLKGTNTTKLKISGWDGLPQTAQFVYRADKIDKGRPSE